MLHDYIEVNGAKFDFATNKHGKGAPTKSTEGVIGVLYLDEDTKQLYVCTGEVPENYQWEIFKSGNETAVLYTPQELTPEQQEQAQRNIGVTGEGGTGISQTEKDLMMALFEATPYTSDMSSTIRNLKAIWAGGAGTKYAITYHLTDVTAEPKPGDIAEGSGLTINLRANGGKDIATVKVLMGGKDITAQAYSNRRIVITAVTGDVDITASASAKAYTQVEYIYATGVDGYINTEHVLQPDEVLEFGVTVEDSNAWANPLSANSGGKKYGYKTRADGAAGRTSFARRPGVWNAAGQTNQEFKWKANEKYEIVEKVPGTAVISGGGETCTISDPESANANTPIGKIMLFRSAYANGVTAGGSIGMKMYEVKVKNTQGAVTADFVPVKDLSGKPAFYEKNSKKFFYDMSEKNQLAAGPEV